MPKGKLTYDSAEEFKINNYWGSPNDYQTVLYLNFEFGRPTFEAFKEVSQDAENNNVVTFEAITESISFDVLYVMPMLTTLFAIPLHDRVTIEILKTGQVFSLSNISINDTGAQGDTEAKQTITAQLTAIAGSTGCADQGYIKVSC
jgi:hypothetical protein